MATRLEERIGVVLASRQAKGLLRELRPPSLASVDFSSNDYLGFNKAGPFLDYLESQDRRAYSELHPGSTGSRLLSGHSEQMEKLEQTAAAFHDAESSLLFNSGYDANLSLLSCVPGEDDSIVYDELIHASVHDGMRMGRAKSNTLPFRHNDLDSCRETVLAASTQCKGVILVCVESVYSMDGDVVPLRDLLALACNLSSHLRRDVLVVVDEAHAGGLYGDSGQGLVFAEDLQKHPNLLARVVTFGKAFGAHGAVVLCSILLKQCLINYARPFIYSTALPPHSVAILMAVYEFAKSREAQEARGLLWRRVKLFRKLASDELAPNALVPVNGHSPIHGLLVPGNRACVKLSQALRQQGFDVYPIRSPTVPKGTERIRIIIHASNSEDEIRKVIAAIRHEQSQWDARL